MRAKKAASRKADTGVAPAVVFNIVNDEVALDRGHARALLELLLPDIKRDLDREYAAKAFSPQTEVDRPAAPG